MTTSYRPRSSWLPDAPPRAPRTLDEALELEPEATLAVLGAPRDVLAIEVRRAVERGLDVLVVGEGLSLEDEREEKSFARARGRLLLLGDAVIDGIALAASLPSPRRGVLGVVASDVGAAAEAMVVAERAGVGVSQVLVVGPADVSESLEGVGALGAIARLGADPSTRALFVVGPSDPRVARAVQHACVETSKPSVSCSFRGDPRRGLGWEIVETISDLPRALARLGVEDGGPARLAPGHGGATLVGAFSSASLAHEAIAVAFVAGLDVASDVPCPGVLPPDVGGHTLVVELDPRERAERLRALVELPTPRAVVLDLARTPRADAEAEPLISALRDIVFGARSSGREVTVSIARGPGATFGPLDRELLDLGCEVAPTIGEAMRRALRFVAGEDEARRPFAGKPLSVLALAAEPIARRLDALGVAVLPIAWTPPAGGDARIARLVGLLR